MARGIGIGVVLFSLAAGAAEGQQQVQVSYDVEFTTTGALLSGPGVCGSAAGIDKLSGTITGPEPDPGDDNTYRGTLLRDTDVTFCYVARRPNTDEDYHCSVNIKGQARVPVEFKLYADNRGGYLQALGRGATVTLSSVTGNCNNAEMAEWQRDYGKMETAGSPGGQPIDVPGLPRTGPFPKTYAPGVARAVSEGDIGIWTLKVLGRRP
jgi:hypothetical protein